MNLRESDRERERGRVALWRPGATLGRSQKIVRVEFWSLVSTVGRYK